MYETRAGMICYEPLIVLNQRAYHHMIRRLRTTIVYMLTIRKHRISKLSVIQKEGILGIFYIMRLKQSHLTL